MLDMTAIIAATAVRQVCPAAICGIILELSQTVSLTNPVETFAEMTF
jgi:hypothetical protein